MYRTAFAGDARDRVGSGHTGHPEPQTSRQPEKSNHVYVFKAVLCFFHLRTLPDSLIGFTQRRHCAHLSVYL
jgi:hypothetical protein